MPTFVPGLDASPFPYEQCPFLTAPQPPFTFAGLAYRIKLFTRERIVDRGARILWGDFFDASDNADGNLNRSWARSLAAPLITLGLMYGQPAGKGGEGITFQEFLNLEWELFQLADFDSLDSTARGDERASIGARLQTSRLKGVVSDHAINTARVIWNLSHATNNGFADTDASPLTLARDWAIYQRIRDQYGQHGGETDHEFLSMERTLFLTTPRLFVRAGCDLLARYLAEKRRPEDTPGVFFLPKQRDWEGYTPDVSLDDYLAVIRNLGIKASELRSRGETLLHQGTPQNRRALFEEVRRHPIMVLDDYPAEDEAILITGPARLFKAISRFLLHDTVEHFGIRLGNAASRRGVAFEKYLEEAITETGVRRLEPNGQMTPDFEWLGHKYGVLIEAKVKPLTSQMINSPEALVTAWDNLMEAVEQASSYAYRFSGARPEKWVLIVVVNDAYADEQTSFRHVTSSWRVLDQTPLAGLAVLRANDFEHLVHSSTADEAGAMLEELWLDAGSRSPLDQPPPINRCDGGRVPRVLNDAHRDLFGCAVP